MDGEMEKLPILDALGIVGEALKILSGSAKLLGAIAFTLLPPLAFVILGHRIISEPLLSKIMMNNELLGIDAFGPATEIIRHSLCLQIAELLLVTAVYITLICGFSMLSTSAVVYTVGSIYTGKELTYTWVMTILPRVWKRVMLTFFWIFLILFLYCVGTVGALLLWALISGVVGLNKGTLLIGFVAIGIVAVSFHLYIAMVWQVASVVCVVEERYGLDAVEKSKQLIEGNRVTALALTLLYLVLMGIVGGYQSYSAYGERQKVMSLGVIVVVVLQCAVDLVWLLSHWVLYFVCKSCHCEDIDKVDLSNHLEMYHGGYMLLKDGYDQFEKFGPQTSLPNRKPQYLAFPLLGIN